MVLSPILKKLLFVRQFDIDNGKIKLLGDSEIMLNALAILELQEIDESKLYDIAKRSSFKKMSSFVEHAKVYKKMKDVFMTDAARLGTKIGETDTGVIKTLQELFNVYGLGEMLIQEIDNKQKEALIMIRKGTLAQEWMKKKRTKSKMPVCTLTSGVIAGIFSYIFKKEVDCVEAKCIAQGYGQCMFKVA